MTDNQPYVRVPLAVFEQMADVLSDIDFLQANITDKSTIKEKVAQGHQLIADTLGEKASVIYAEEN